ncbi:MAG: hypothetical protein M1489_06575 [Firmicutes bacterium]|nr:hypothetical protein [Bacillota bacterium]
MRKSSQAAWQFQRYALATLLVDSCQVAPTAPAYCQFSHYALRRYSSVDMFGLSTAAERSAPLLE